MNNQLVNNLPAFENPFYPKEPDNYPNIRCIWIRADGIEFYMKVKPAKHDISSADSKTSSSHPRRVSSTGRPADILDEWSTRLPLPNVSKRPNLSANRQWILREMNLTIKENFQKKRSPPKKSEEIPATTNGRAASN